MILNASAPFNMVTDTTNASSGSELAGIATAIGPNGIAKSALKCPAGSESAAAKAHELRSCYAYNLASP